MYEFGRVASALVASVEPEAVVGGAAAREKRANRSGSASAGSAVPHHKIAVDPNGSTVPPHKIAGCLHGSRGHPRKRRGRPAVGGWGPVTTLGLLVMSR